jgi:hypothetical protein
VILSVPASVNRNAPLVSLAGSIQPQGPNGAKTIPFKNVLDGLDAFGTPGDDNAGEEQKTGSQGATFKKNLPDPTPGKPLNSATPHGASQIQFTNQNLAQLAATLARPTEEAAQPKQTSSPENDGSTQNTASFEDSSIADALQTPAAEPAEQDLTESTPAKTTQRPGVESSSVLTSALPSFYGTAVAPATRLATNVPVPSVPANFAPAKSSATEARTVTTAAPSVSPTPVKTIPAKTIPVKSVAAKGIAAVPSLTSSKTQTRTVPSSSAPAPSQAKPTPLAASSKVLPEAPALAQPPAQGATVRVKTAPRESETPIKPEVKPMESATATPVPEEQPAPAPQANQPDAAPAKIAESATPVPETPVPAVPVTTPPSPMETAAVTTSVATAAVSAAKPNAPSTKPKDASSRQAVSQDSNAPSTSTPPAVTRMAPVAGPVATSAESARPESETPDSSATPRSGAERTTATVVAAPKAPLAPNAENLAFAVRMLAPDTTPVEQTKPAVTLAEPQIGDPKPAVNQPNPAPAQAPENQQPQSQASSDSKRDAQSPASTSDKTDTHAPKAAELPQPADARQTVTRWSEISTMQPSDVSSTRVSSDLAEPAHASSALAAQETHVMAPELPKSSSTSSEILLHLTGNDQSSAAIRVAERGGSVNVTVHASDPVLRESLRSNLGELSTQLSQQGWKAEALKPAAIAAQQESQQDSHGDGQRSSQQQSFGGDRQPQRDRRAPGGHWQQELEQQISGGDAHPGGNR